MGQGLAGVDVDGFTVVLNSPVLLAEVLVGKPAVVIGHVKPGIDFNGPVKFPDGPGVVLLVAKIDSPLVVFVGRIALRFRRREQGMQHGTHELGDHLLLPGAAGADSTCTPCRSAGAKGEILSPHICSGPFTRRPGRKRACFAASAEVSFTRGTIGVPLLRQSG